MNTLYGILLGGAFNTLKQVFIEGQEEINWERVKSDAFIGFTIGSGLDIAKSFSSPRQISVCELPDGLHEVWDKGEEIKGKNANEWRYDTYCNPIQCSEYGNRRSEFGWEKDHIEPKSKGGLDVLENFQPLQWRENVRKGNKYPYNPCEYQNF